MCGSVIWSSTSTTPSGSSASMPGAARGSASASNPLWTESGVSRRAISSGRTISCAGIWKPSSVRRRAAFSVSSNLRTLRAGFDKAEVTECQPNRITGPSPPPGPRATLIPRLSTRSRTARLVAAALASAPEPALVFAVALPHAAFISRAAASGNLAAQNGPIGPFPIDLRGWRPDKRGPFRCRTTLYIKEVRIECRLSPGGVPEWLKGTDCKSVGLAYVGSNPTPSTNSHGAR